jgi:hypothetical protein
VIAVGAALLGYLIGIAMKKIVPGVQLPVG